MAVESEVTAEGSVDRVLNGQQYNRGVRLHKLLYEALKRLAWKGFLDWFQKNQAAEQQSLIEDSGVLFVGLTQSTNQENLDSVLHNPRLALLFDLFQQYLSFLRSDGGPLAQFWMSYIDMVETLLHLIGSSREGNWLLHLYAIRAVLPWCFANDRINYSRYLSVYYAEMKNSIDHPDVYVQLENAGFSVQLGRQNPFGRIPVDQTIEVTVNRDTQTPGGTKGFSLKPAALSRYYLTAEHRSICLKKLRDLTDIKPPGVSHHDLESSCIRKDELAVQSLVDFMETEWINPFSGDPTELISLSTGTVAPSDVQCTWRDSIQELSRRKN